MDKKLPATIRRSVGASNTLAKNVHASRVSSVAARVYVAVVAGINGRHSKVRGDGARGRLTDHNPRPRATRNDFFLPRPGKLPDQRRRDIAGTGVQSRISQQTSSILVVHKDFGAKGVADRSQGVRGCSTPVRVLIRTRSLFRSERTFGSGLPRRVVSASAPRGPLPQLFVLRAQAADLGGLGVDHGGLALDAVRLALQLLGEIVDMGGGVQAQRVGDVRPVGTLVDPVPCQGRPGAVEADLLVCSRLASATESGSSGNLLIQVAVSGGMPRSWASWAVMSIQVGYRRSIRDFPRSSCRGKKSPWLLGMPWQNWWFIFLLGCRFLVILRFSAISPGAARSLPLLN